MSAASDKGSCTPPFTEVATDGRLLTFTSDCRLPEPFSHTQGGGSALVRRRIQTPSDATVLSVVQPEGEVVLGASPLARRPRRRAGGRIRSTGKARRPLMSPSQATSRRPAAHGGGPEGGYGRRA